MYVLWCTYMYKKLGLMSIGSHYMNRPSELAVIYIFFLKDLDV